MRFDEGDHHGRRTGGPPEPLDQQPAEAHDPDSHSSCGLLSPLSIGEAQLSEVQVFVTSSLVNSAQAKLDELGIPSVHRLNESEWIPRATYETRYLRRTAR